MAPGLGDERPGPRFIDDIEGEKAFLDGKAPHISGLGASGDQLTITLVKPSSMHSLHSSKLSPWSRWTAMGMFERLTAASMSFLR